MIVNNTTYNPACENIESRSIHDRSCCVQCKKYKANNTITKLNSFHVSLWFYLKSKINEHFLGVSLVFLVALVHGRSQPWSTSFVRAINHWNFTWSRSCISEMGTKLTFNATWLFWYERDNGLLTRFINGLETLCSSSIIWSIYVNASHMRGTLNKHHGTRRIHE